MCGRVSNRGWDIILSRLHWLHVRAQANQRLVGGVGVSAPCERRNLHGGRKFLSPSCRRGRYMEAIPKRGCRPILSRWCWLYVLAPANQRFPGTLKSQVGQRIFVPEKGIICFPLDLALCASPVQSATSQWPWIFLTVGEVSSRGEHRVPGLSEIPIHG